MSKKKASSNSTTMTLKDFHGGSIPSDLPLPSAPGAMLRPADRVGFERQTSWSNPIGRSDHKLRPSSAGTTRSFDDKTPFLGPSSHIGRNFDEDERKPLDGVTAPRRTVSDETTRAPPASSELKPDYSSAERLPSRQVLNPVSQFSGSNASSNAARFGEATHIGVNSQRLAGNGSNSARFPEAGYVGVSSQSIGGNSGNGVSGTYPNAWAARKEAVTIADVVPLAGSGANSASKLAHASALEKISSGRWQSRQSAHYQTDVEVIRHSEIESEFSPKVHNIYSMSAQNGVAVGMVGGSEYQVAGGRDYHDAALTRNAERRLAVDDGLRVGGRELPAVERAKSPLNFKTKERNPSMRADAVQAAANEGKYCAPELQSPVPSEPSERPKLKLLPRSKPLENLESPVDNKLGQEQPTDFVRVENANESFGNANATKLGQAGFENGNQAIDRPKLNLKPRSQPLQQLEGNFPRERKTVFGGARPRELVLKDRGVDDVAVNNQELGQPSNRGKQDVTRTETVVVHPAPTSRNEKAENVPLDHRIKKNTESRDHRVDVERNDLQRKNWRNENWRSGREIEKHQQQQLQERPPSPETWRKPVEPPTSTSADATGLRYGKAASAVELAQAFSKSISDPKTADRFPSQRGIPGRGQKPFSRLMDPNAKPQINGY